MLDWRAFLRLLQCRSAKSVTAAPGRGYRRFGRLARGLARGREGEPALRSRSTAHECQIVPNGTPFVPNGTPFETLAVQFVASLSQAGAEIKPNGTSCETLAPRFLASTALNRRARFRAAANSRGCVPRQWRRRRRPCRAASRAASDRDPRGSFDIEVAANPSDAKLIG